MHCLHISFLQLAKFKHLHYIKVYATAEIVIDRSTKSVDDYNNAHILVTQDGESRDCVAFLVSRSSSQLYIWSECTEGGVGC